MSVGRSIALVAACVAAALVVTTFAHAQGAPTTAPGAPAPGQAPAAAPAPGMPPAGAPPAQPGRGPQAPGRGERARGMFGPGGMGAMAGMMQTPPAIAVADGFVFVVYGGTLFQFTVDGLQPVNKVALIPEGRRELMRVRGQPGGEQGAQPGRAPEAAPTTAAAADAQKPPATTETPNP